MIASFFGRMIDRGGIEELLSRDGPNRAPRPRPHPAPLCLAYLDEEGMSALLETELVIHCTASELEEILRALLILSRRTDCQSYFRKSCSRRRIIGEQSRRVGKWNRIDCLSPSPEATRKGSSLRIVNDPVGALGLRAGRGDPYVSR